VHYDNVVSKRPPHRNRVRPARAVVVTHHGLVRVEWLEVAGNRCWFSSGTGDAKREAVPAIEHIEQMCMTMH